MSARPPTNIVQQVPPWLQPRTARLRYPPPTKLGGLWSRRALALALRSEQNYFRMSASTPPKPDREGWPADYVSSNGATANVRIERDRRLVVLGYITAVAMPLIGFILGIVVATRPLKSNSKHATGIIALSIIASIVWTLVFTSGVFSVPSNDLSY